MEKCTNKTGHSSLDSLRKGKLRDMEFICLRMGLTIRGILAIIVQKEKGYSGLPHWSMKEDSKTTNFMGKGLKKVRLINTLENFMREIELRVLTNGKSGKKSTFSPVILTSQTNFMAQVYQ